MADPTQPGSKNFSPGPLLILTMLTIMLDDYLKTNPGVKDLPWQEVEPRQAVIIAVSSNDPIDTMRWPIIIEALSGIETWL